MSIAGLFCLLPLTGIAQWQWIDPAGHKVFSAREPSSDIAEKNILRRPDTSPSRATFFDSTSAANPTERSEPGAAPARAQASLARPSGVDKTLEQNKTRARQKSPRKPLALSRHKKSCKPKPTTAHVQARAKRPSTAEFESRASMPKASVNSWTTRLGRPNNRACNR